MTLIEATGRAEKKDGEVREDARNFSLVFVDAAGTVDSHLPQATYRFEHDELGSLELFIVPIGPGLDGDRMRYEAVFTSSP